MIKKLKKVFRRRGRSSFSSKGSVTDPLSHCDSASTETETETDTETATPSTEGWDVDAARSGHEGDLLPFVSSYIRRCQPNKEKADEAVRTYADFRRRHCEAVGINPRGEISRSAIEIEDRSRKLEFISAKDPCGAHLHIAVLVIKRHLRNGVSSLSVKVCHLIYYVEEVIRRLEERGGEFQLIVNASKIGVKNVDLPIFHEVRGLQKVFRDLMSRIDVVDASFVFTQAFKMLRPFLSPRIVGKFHFLKSEEERARLSACSVNVDLIEL